jgi:DNA end-binding protein Ku
VFVPVDEIAPVMFDASYHVLPGEAAKPYALLAGAMAGTGRMGIGRLVMHQKEYLAAVGSDGEHLALSILVFRDEVVQPQSLEDFDVIESVTVSDREPLGGRRTRRTQGGRPTPARDDRSPRTGRRHRSRRAQERLTPSISSPSPIASGA